MENVNKIYGENRDTVIILLIPIAIIAKLIEHLILPDKYFYDSSRMLDMMLGTGKMAAWGGNYEFTADFFSKLNIFNFTSLLEWSVLIGIIFNIVLLIVFARVKGLNFMQSIFALMCVGLCNIYVFNLGKDIIQFALFALCFLIIYIDKIPNWIKVVGCALVFYWESTFFRNYYIIMSAFTIGVYFIVAIIRRKKVKLNFRMWMFLLCALYLMMYIFLNIARVMMPEEYNDILHCKDGVEIMGATTALNDNIEFGTDINLFMLNYIINSVRMLFPLELMQGGIFYMPFLLFQIALLYYMYKSLKDIHLISEKNVIALCTFIGFFMGSVLFEPDFGSFARHEAASFPIIILFALDNSGIWKREKMHVKDKKRLIIYE